jgi:PAS domain S-box-containing protein
MPAELKLRAFADFLCDRREEITRQWVNAVRTDPAIPSSTKVPHEELVDHLPRVFEDLAETLRSPAAPREATAEHAHAHGKNRWWQGFRFTELLREVSILRRIISVQHLAAFAAENPEWALEARSHAESVVHTFFDRIFAESAQEFVETTEKDRTQFRALFESTAGAYLVVKPADYEIVAVSDSYLEATSTTRERLIGQKLFDVFPDAPGDPAADGVRNIRASLEKVKEHRVADAIPVQRYPIRLSAAQGGGWQERFWSPINSPVFGPAGDLAFIIHRVEDVTPYVLAQQEASGADANLSAQPGAIGLEAEIVRRTQELVRSNDQLRRSEDRFKLAVEIAKLGTFEIDLRTDAVQVNDEARAIYGWPAAPLTFTQVQTHFHPDDRDQVLAAVGQAFDPATSSDEFDVEQRIYRTDGAIRWIRVRARAFFDTEGPARQPITCVGTFLDVTERKQNDTALLESESRFRQLADTIPQLAWMAKPDGWIFWYNRRWHEFTGMTPEEMEGWGWEGVHDPKELPRVVENWSNALATEQPWQDTFPLRRKDGEFRIHLSRANPFRDAAGRVVLWFGTNTDITELVRAQEAAQSANRAKDQFIAVLSHELRTPLTPVLATIMDLNARADLPPVVTEAVDLIRRNVELEARLIDDLLDVTRISKGKLRMDREVVALDSVLRDALRICNPDIVKKQIRVASDFQAPNHTVEGDAPRLLQAFWNLLQNAVKFTPAGGAITLRTRGDADALGVEITDTGIGIETEAMPRIFEAFGQADETISRRFGGLGLGLALSKALVEAHGGSVQASSAGRNKGTTFTVELKTTARAAAAADKATGAGDSAVRGLRILLVEDHDDTRRTLSRLIERWGHQVTTAATLAEGFQQAAENQFDLLVSDLGLPDGHGNDLMRSLHQTRGLRGIAVSGFGTDEDVARSLDAGFELHLAKPVGAQRLKAAIAEIASAPLQGAN